MLTTTADIRALAASLVAPELIVYPVRHHSPACAWHLRRLMQAAKPSAVLVEGPRSFTSLIPLLTHAEARMPLAIYTYTVERAADAQSEHRHAAFYPFCDYSPELVALREAQATGIPSRFIDLDYAEQSHADTDNIDEDAESLLDERHFRRSQHLQALAARLGCRDHEELWEHLFEVSAATVSLQEHLARVAAYCQLSRIDATTEELTRDGTLRREAEMAFHIRAALGERHGDAGPVLAVVGGFHAVVLPELVRGSTQRPATTRRNVTEEASALVRYGYERLDRLNGYAAGMTSPAWHQLLWDQTTRHERLGEPASPRIRRNAAITMLADIALELRDKHRIALPMPALGAAYEQALRLAELRQRRAPVRDDVMDAVTSCFVKGEADADGAIVLAVARRILSGVAIGKVPPGAPTPPLVKDFEYRARRQRLKIDDSAPKRAVLDLYRRPAHRQTSRLLHGLAFLAIPFGVRTAGPDFVSRVGLDRLQEHWEYAYSTATEAALVEASVLGSTVPLAVSNRFLARLDALQADGQTSDARSAAALMAQACVLGLHDHLPRVMDLLRGAIASDAAFDSVAAAVANLGILLESGEALETGDVDELPSLLEAAYQRAMFLGRELRGTQCDPEAVVKSLAQLRELIVSQAGRALDAELYWAMIADLQQHPDSALIRGAASGLRYAAGRLADAELGLALEGHLRGHAQPKDAVAFLRGVLQTAREAAWQQPALLDVLDRLLREWDEDGFVASLPELRLAFAGMTPKETDRIADAVAALHGVGRIGPLVSHDIDEETLRRNLALSRTVAAIMQRDGLGEWTAQ